MAEKGLMSGTGEGGFEPYANTTRGMIVTVLHSLAGKQELPLVLVLLTWMLTNGALLSLRVAVGGQIQLEKSSYCVLTN